jgi:lipid-binding SYLF domain-containing protein
MPGPVLPIAALMVLAGCAAPTMEDQITRSIGTLQHVRSQDGLLESDQLAAARGVAILDQSQWALVVGGSGGRGVILKRQAGGEWSAPCAIKASSLTVGLGIGGEGRSIVVVFEREEALDRFVARGGAFVAEAQGTFGASHGHAGDPYGRGEGVRAYIVAEGVFASAALGGMSLKVDAEMNEATYGPGTTAWDILDGHVKPPPGSRALAARLQRVTGPSGRAPLRVASTPPTPPSAQVVDTPVEIALEDEPAAPPRRPSVER